MNKIVLMGLLTKDPEQRFGATNNTAICNFTLAVNRRFKSEGQPDADFFNIVAFAKSAEFCSKYFIKGLQVVVVGHLQNRSWEDNGGVKHYATDVVAEETYFADSKKDSGSGSAPAKSNNSGQSDEFYPIDDSSDDLPF
jgi:single-strand DNA-binding protein